MQRLILRAAFLFFCLRLLSPAFAADTAVITAIQDLIAKGDLTSASAQLEQALRSAPGDGGLYNLRGIISADQGRFDEAEQDFSSAVKLSPNLVSAYLNLGRVLKLRSGNDGSSVARAIAAYEKAVQLAPNSEEAHLELATLFEWRGLFAESLRHLAALPPRTRQKARPLALQCADLSGLQRSDEAERAALALLAAPDLSNDEINTLLPVVRTKAGPRLQQLVIEAALKRGLATGEDETVLAESYEKAGRLAEARQTLEGVARKQPEAIEPLIQLARVSYKQGRREDALGYLAHARDLAPRNATVHFVFGIIALELKLLLEAQDEVGKAVALAPDNPDFNYGMGVVKLHGHDTLEAVPYFQKFLTAKSNSARGHYGLGAAYYFGAKYAEAAEQLRLALGSPETNAGAHFFLGKIAKVNGDDQTAGAEFRAAIKENPHHVEAHAELALLLTREQRFQEAKAELDRALKAEPDNITANTSLLELYQKMKDARSEQQRERLQSLQKRRDELQDLLYRRIEVRPY